MVNNGKKWIDSYEKLIKTSDNTELYKCEKSLVELELSYVLNYSVIEKYLVENFDDVEKLMLEYSIGHYSEIIKILEVEKSLLKEFEKSGKYDNICRKIIRFKNKLNRFRIRLKNYGNIRKVS